MNTQDVGDPKQRGDTRVRMAGLDVLKRLAPYPGGEEHALLCPVLTEAFDADAVADGASAVEQPGVIIGQVGHPTDTRLIMILSQPGKPGIL